MQRVGHRPEAAFAVAEQTTFGEFLHFVGRRKYIEQAKTVTVLRMSLLIPEDHIGGHLPEQRFVQLVLLTQENRHFREADKEEAVTGEVAHSVDIVGDDERVAVELRVAGRQRHQFRAQFGAAQMPASSARRHGSP